MQNQIKSVFDLHAGDQVILVSDDWDSESDVVIVDAEPVPGSTQCLIKAGGEMRFVSRTELRLAA